jgi:hypothetical protein
MFRFLKPFLRLYNIRDAFQVHSFSDSALDGAGSGGSPSQNKKDESLYDWMRRLQVRTNDRSSRPESS